LALHRDGHRHIPIEAKEDREYAVHHDHEEDFPSPPTMSCAARAISAAALHRKAPRQQATMPITAAMTGAFDQADREMIDRDRIAQTSAKNASGSTPP